jgi:hypothetical protein
VKYVFRYVLPAVFVVAGVLYAVTAAVQGSSGKVVGIWPRPVDKSSRFTARIQGRITEAPIGARENCFEIG